jgi:hypothetical protein
MQRIAQDWLVLTQLTHHDASVLGIVMGLQFAASFAAKETGLHRRIRNCRQSFACAGILVAGRYFGGTIFIVQMYRQPAICSRTVGSPKTPSCLRPASDTWQQKPTEHNPLIGFSIVNRLLDQSLHDRNQLVAIKGLHNPACCSRLPSGILLLSLGLGRKHKDRSKPVSLHLPRSSDQLNSVDIRHVQISDDQVKFPGTDFPKTLFSIDGLRHFVARFAQSKADHLTDAR